MCTEDHLRICLLHLHRPEVYIFARCFQAQTFKLANMSEVAPNLVSAQRWAEIAISALEPDDSLLWSEVSFPTSSMFSGACYAERCLEYISSARQGLKASMPVLAEAGHQVKRGLLPRKWHVSGFKPYIYIYIYVYLFIYMYIDVSIYRPFWRKTNNTHIYIYL